MIGIIDVIGAVNKLIHGEFPDIPIETKDVEEGFKRPCFYTDWKGIDSGTIGETLDDESFVLIVYYFPKDRHTNTVELMKVQKTLKSLFGLMLTVRDDFIIPIDEKSFNVSSDKVLSVEIALRYIQDVHEEDGFLIEEMEFKL